MSGTTFHGIMPRPTGTHVNSAAFGRDRFMMRNAWKSASYTKRDVRAMGEFRIMMNAGDPLSRQNVAVENDGIPLASGNGRFVYDTSDYIKYLRRRAMSRNYNDPSF